MQCNYLIKEKKREKKRKRKDQLVLSDAILETKYSRIEF